MRGRFVVILIFSLLLIVPCVFAESEKSGTIKLLAMIQKGEEKQGSTARLDLEIKKGSDRVFLETFPLTKISTQVSMRFAQQITCSELDLDCSGYDFFYTISAIPGIVGGPSAGAAASVLTAALLLDLDIRADSAITGTMNSGGIIGAVGGIKGKVKASADNGINLVVIPKGTRIQKEVIDEKNITTDLIEYGDELNITVVEAATLAEALEYMTGYKIEQIKEPFVIDPQYKKTMKSVAQILCERNEKIHKKVITKRIESGAEKTTKKEEQALNYTAQGQIKMENKEYYSAASYCFRSNVALKKIFYSYEDYSQERLDYEIDVLNAKIGDFDDSINEKNISTITDLQTFMAVNERTSEARKIVEASSEEENLTKAIELFAFAEERLFSAKSWSTFFNGADITFELDEKRLMKSCQSKIEEAEERYGYLKSILPSTMGNIREEIDGAYSMLEEKEYVVCLYKAIKAKAAVDVVLGLVGVEEDQLPELMDLKLEIVQQTLSRAQKKGIFPIIGYSYYEYSNSLKNSDQYSSLLFAEYALEFSNIDIYFPQKNIKPFSSLLNNLSIEILIAFAGGIIIGFLVMKNYKTLQTPPKKRLRGKKR